MASIERDVSFVVPQSAADALAQLDSAAATGGARIDERRKGFRIYSMGSPGWYRFWGAWARIQTFPLQAHVSVVEVTDGTAVMAKIVSNEGPYLVRLPNARRQGNRAIDRILKLFSDALDATWPGPSP